MICWQAKIYMPILSTKKKHELDLHGTSEVTGPLKKGKDFITMEGFK